MKVSVSILSEKDNYISAIKKIDKTSANYIHLDIMDSSFTTDSSFTLDDFKNIKDITNKKLDIHIMSTNLDKKIEEYSTLKPEFITFHVEVKDTLEYINKVKEKGIKVGLAINPDTDLEEIYPYLEIVDLILVMSVIPGKGGQKFMTDTICKMQELKEIEPSYNFVIEVDGGVNDETIKYISNYADIVVSGSYITNSNDYEENIQKLRK